MTAVFLLLRINSASSCPCRTPVDWSRASRVASRDETCRPAAPSMAKLRITMEIRTSTSEKPGAAGGGHRSAKVLHGVAILGYWGVARCAFCLRVFAVDLDAGRWLRSIFYLRVYPRHAPALCMPLHSRYACTVAAVVSSELLRW